MRTGMTGTATPWWQSGHAAAIVAGALIAVGGVAAEIVSSTPAATAVLDWSIGAAFVAAALCAAPTDRRSTQLGMLCATAWYVATAAAAAPSGMFHALGMLTALAYRGPLLHWVVRRAGAAITGSTAVLLTAGYAVCPTGTLVSAWGTTAVCATLAVVVLVGSRRREVPADVRRNLTTTAWVLGGLTAVWGLSALAPSLSRVVTAAGLSAVAWHLSRRAASGLTGAVGDLVLDLGPTGRPTSPVAASLARALADPDLLIRTFQPDTGWTDDHGRPVADPRTERGGHAVTEVATPTGGRVVLLHGPRGAGDGELARAAAQAAALALESVRVEALVRHQALDVRRSAARLVTVEETQRRALAERLRTGPIARLERVRRSGGDHSADTFVAETERIIDDLDRLAHGLDPAALADGRSVREALLDLSTGAGVPVDCDVDEKVDRLPRDVATLVYYAVSECLTNIARHSGAAAARLQVRLDRALVLDIRDDGSGGATANPGGGLQGLVNRLAIAGGTLWIDSPVGGPTGIRAEMPLPPDA